MPDSRVTDSWLEAQLSRQLCPVSAPDALWNRIHEQRRPLRVRPRLHLMWSIAAFALLIVSTGMFWRLGLTRDPTEEISSSDAQQIRTWVKAKSNIDIPLPDRSTFGRILGARIVRLRQYSVAIINYKVGSESATMLVTNRHAIDEGRNPGHTSPRVSQTANTTSYSWSLGPDDYTIAFTGAKESRAACLLCHVNTPALMVFR
ncbi:MAG TPA: hypothetical protein VHX12_00620 [Acidisoma sp.]|jgi:hypothetical protein|nr:hypothetical protein [Acidisoma sp.]